MERILIVDDDLDILEFIKYNLEKEEFSVELASNAKEALEKVKKMSPNLVLLDIMLPDIDGIETCLKIRELKIQSQPIIAFLTARNEDYSQIAGFEAGGDDFIAKPIKPRVLVSRLKALLRRNRGHQTKQKENIHFGDVSLNHEKHVFIKHGEEIHLPRKQFDILSLLIANAGNVVRRTDLMGIIWGDVFVSDRNIDVQIRKIREKIGDNLIKTIKGVGYKFDPKAAEIA